MLRFGVQASDFDRTKQLLAHIPGAAEKAMARAINKAISTANTEAIKRVKGRYTISDSELRRGIKIIKATNNHLTATLIATSSLHRIAKFKVGKGPNVEVIKGNNKKFPYSFLAKMKSGHVGLFAREEKYVVPGSQSSYASKLKSKNASRGQNRGEKGSVIRRQKIVEVSSVSTAEMVGYYEIIEETMKIAEEKLAAELDRQVALFLQGKVK